MAEYRCPPRGRRGDAAGAAVTGHSVCFINNVVAVSAIGV